MNYISSYYYCYLLVNLVVNLMIVINVSVFLLSISRYILINLITLLIFTIYLRIK